MNIIKLKQYAYGNIGLLFWSLFLLIGGAIFISYYAYIAYIPDFDFKSAITLLSAVSATAILSVSVLAISLIMPGVLWSNTLAEDSPLKNHWVDEKNNKSILKIGAWFSFSILFFFTVFGLFYWNWKWAIIFFIFGIVVCLYLFFKILKLRNKVLFEEVFKMLLISSISSLFAFIPIYCIILLSSSNIDASKDHTIFLGVTTAIIIAFINIIATTYSYKSNGLMPHIVLSLSALCFLFLSFGEFPRIPIKIMELYKLGAINTNSIVFKSDACKTLELQGLLINDKSEEKIPKKQCLLKGVKILSRLGESMYLEKDDIRITIKNTEILSWSIKKTSSEK